MKTLDVNIRPRGPVVPSQLTAHKLMTEWVKENDFSVLTDGDGMSWDLELVSREVPDPDNPYGLVWEIAIVLKADATVQKLIDGGIIDPNGDERLIQLLGTPKIPFSMRPKVLTGKSDDEVRKKVIETLPILRRDVAQARLRDIKRKLLGKWVDDSRQF